MGSGWPVHLYIHRSRGFNLFLLSNNSCVYYAETWICRTVKETKIPQERNENCLISSPVHTFPVDHELRVLASCAGKACQCQFLYYSNCYNPLYMLYNLHVFPAKPFCLFLAGSFFRSLQAIYWRPRSGTEIINIKRFQKAVVSSECFSKFLLLLGGVLIQWFWLHSLITWQNLYTVSL